MWSSGLVGVFCEMGHGGMRLEMVVEMGGGLEWE
jgi:hypothetical protein